MSQLTKDGLELAIATQKQRDQLGEQDVTVSIPGFINLCELALKSFMPPEALQYVFVIESGEYEQRSIYGVAASLDAAAAIVRAPYVAPYIVRWDDPAREDDDRWTLTGHFTRVEGYCGDGPSEWSITRYAVSPRGTK